MPSVGFGPAIPATKRLESYALERTTTGTGNIRTYPINYKSYPIVQFYINIGTVMERGSKGG